MAEMDNNLPPISPNSMGHKSPKITISLPSKDSGKISSGEGVLETSSTLEATSLNDAYRRLKEGGLIAVPGDFRPLGGISKKIIVDPGNPGSEPWNLVKAAVPSPRGNIKDGINSEAKSLPGPMLSSTSAENPSNLGRVVTSTRRRRRRRKKTPVGKKDQKLFGPADGAENDKRKRRGEQSELAPTQVSVFWLTVLPSITHCHRQKLTSHQSISLFHYSSFYQMTFYG